jgi:hypothetical protein
MPDAFIRLFVLCGFLFMAITFLKPNRWWIPGLSVLAFSIALILHIIGMVSP